tara:strand:- start:708 stop:836 length:129 start_codon:yes stop_codon:yes gene_type:complete
MIELLFLTPIIVVVCALITANIFVSKRKKHLESKEWVKRILE